MVSPGDKLSVIPAENGEDARAVCADLLVEFPPATLKYNGEIHSIPQKTRINGEPADEGTLIKADDNVDISMDYTISDIAHKYGIDLALCSFEIDGRKVDPSYRLQGGETIECRIRDLPDPGYEHAELKDPNPAEPERNENEQENPEGKEAEPGSGTGQDKSDFCEELACSDGLAASGDGISVTVNGERILLPLKEGRIFVDIFNHIDFDLPNRKDYCIKTQWQGCRLYRCD